MGLGLPNAYHNNYYGCYRDFCVGTSGQGNLTGVPRDFTSLSGEEIWWLFLQCGQKHDCRLAVELHDHVRLRQVVLGAGLTAGGEV